MKRIDVKKKSGGTPTKKRRRVKQISMFLAINEFCLLEVLKNMSLGDLCKVSRTCERLQMLARMSFVVKYKSLDMKLLKIGENKISLQQAQSLFSNFGDLILDIKVSATDFAFYGTLEKYSDASKLVLLMKEHCTKLQSWTFEHFIKNVSLEFVSGQPVNMT